VLARNLENVGAANVITTAAAMTLLVIVGLAAASLPALRVRRVAPADALRS
jgi:hypothetical protein